MKLLVLSHTTSPLSTFLRECGHVVVEHYSRIGSEFVQAEQYDWVISYGYQYILKSDMIDVMSGRILNLHTSLLPWNRGAYPNLWSFLENTPKGVSIHYIDEGIDTGDIVTQKEIAFKDLKNQTLATTYAILDREIQLLFHETWHAIEAGQIGRTRQHRGGSKHTVKQSAQYLALLQKGWDTPVLEITGIAAKG